MRKILILGLAALLTYGCNQQLIPKPDENLVKNSVTRWTFRTIGIPKSGSQIDYLDANKDGRIDGMSYTGVEGGGTIRLLAYDTTQREYYETYYSNLDRALIMTQSLDSAVNQFMDAAKELKWSYELEKYNQQKRPI